MEYLRRATAAPGVGRLTFLPSETAAAYDALPPAAFSSLPVAWPAGALSSSGTSVHTASPAVTPAPTAHHSPLTATAAELVAAANAAATAAAVAAAADAAAAAAAAAAVGTAPLTAAALSAAATAAAAGAVALDTAACKLASWVVTTVNRSLATYLLRMIQDTELAVRLYDDTKGDGFKMLLGMEKYALLMVTGQRAHIIFLQASAAMLVLRFAPKAGDAAHSFLERSLGWVEIARWAPGACNDDARYDVLRQFVMKLDERSKSKTSIKVYQTFRKASITGCAIIPSGQRADEYETDIRLALLALDEEDCAMATNKQQNAYMALLVGPSSKQELELTKLKAEVAFLWSAAARPPPTARAAMPPPSAALSVSVAPTPVVRRAQPPPSKAKPSPKVDVFSWGDGMTMRNNCVSNPVDNGNGLGKGKHLHRECKVKPTPRPLRGPPQGAGAGGVDPATHNAPRPATAKVASPSISWADSVVPAPALGVSTAVPNNQQYASDFPGQFDEAYLDLYTVAASVRAPGPATGGVPALAITAGDPDPWSDTYDPSGYSNERWSHACSFGASRAVDRRACYISANRRRQYRRTTSACPAPSSRRRQHRRPAAAYTASHVPALGLALNAALDAAAAAALDAAVALRARSCPAPSAHLPRARHAF